MATKLHDNHLNTFRAENGILKVSYDQYDNFTGRIWPFILQNSFYQL